MDGKVEFELSKPNACRLMGDKQALVAYTAASVKDAAREKRTRSSSFRE